MFYNLFLSFLLSLFRFAASNFAALSGCGVSLAMCCAPKLYRQLMQFANCIRFHHNQYSAYKKRKTSLRTNLQAEFITLRQHKRSNKRRFSDGFLDMSGNKIEQSWEAVVSG